MSLELLDARAIPGGIAITFATDKGLETLTGSHSEVAHLAKAMREVSAISTLSGPERVWIEDVVVGDAVVKLGLAAEGQARVRIERRAPAA